MTDESPPFSPSVVICGFSRSGEYLVHNDSLHCKNKKKESFGVILLMNFGSLESTSKMVPRDKLNISLESSEIKKQAVYVARLLVAVFARTDIFPS